MHHTLSWRVALARPSKLSQERDPSDALIVNLLGCVLQTATEGREYIDPNRIEKGARIGEHERSDIIVVEVEERDARRAT